MPLSIAGLSNQLQAELSDLLNIVDPAQLKKVCDAIAKAVVNHIQANALVTGTSQSGGAVTGTVS
jgi:DNA-binding MurR/RpiR family transcriptional regulator